MLITCPRARTARWSEPGLFSRPDTANPLNPLVRFTAAATLLMFALDARAQRVQFPTATQPLSAPPPTTFAAPPPASSAFAAPPVTPPLYTSPPAFGSPVAAPRAATGCRHRRRLRRRLRRIRRRQRQPPRHSPAPRPTRRPLAHRRSLRPLHWPQAASARRRHSIRMPRLHRWALRRRRCHTTTRRRRSPRRKLRRSIRTACRTNFSPRLRAARVTRPRRNDCCRS